MPTAGAFHPVVDARLRIHGVIWNALTGLSLGYALTELLDNLPTDKTDRYLWCLRGDLEAPRPFERVALPSVLFRLLCKAGVSFKLQGRLASQVALRRISPGDIVYIWPPYDLTLIRRARDRGAIVIAERTNCMAAMCRDVLAQAYARRGLSLPKGTFSTQDIAEELEQILACDFVTAPNAFVSQSLRESGVAHDCIIETSYGFSPERLGHALRVERPKRLPVFAFVGVGIVRKGLDVLLEAWGKASVNGSLHIAGLVSDELRSAYANILERPEVKELGYVSDVASVYAAADVFVFPTHEEGGPLVAYEAAACRLASIVSPMGAGRILRHQKEALIIDPLDVDDLATAITSLAEDAVLRERLSVNAALRSQDFTWEKVGARFFEQMSAIAKNAMVLAP
jgi:glycosyltransferase involved in cell wall biosynthesis